MDERPADATVDSEAWLQVALEAADVGTYDWDLRTGRVIRSANAAAMLGLPQDARFATREAFLEVVHPDDRVALMAATEEALRGERLEAEYRIIGPEGRVRWVADRARVFKSPDGRPLRMMGARMDVTTRRETELALRLSEERLQLALAAGRLGSWLLDLRTGALTASQQCKANHGLPASAPLAYDDVVAAVREDAREQFHQTLQSTIASGGSFDTEAPHCWPDGTAHWILVCGRVIDATCMVGVTLDITERKATEERIRELNERKDLFIATLAHELRQPIAPMVTAVALMRSRAGVERGQRARGVIERQIDHLTHLVDDLIDSARVAQGKVQLQLQRVALGDVMADAVNVATSWMGERQHDLEVAGIDERMVVVGDRVRLQQVFSNLLINAAKYTEPGGRIRVNVRLHDDVVEASVSDSGRGIAPDVLPKVFDMFMQADSASGLGLPVVKRLVELHGGTIVARSDGLGCGSEFTVRFPLATTV